MQNAVAWGPLSKEIVVPYNRARPPFLPYARGNPHWMNEGIRLQTFVVRSEQIMTQIDERIPYWPIVCGPARRRDGASQLFLLHCRLPGLLLSG
jgi:hypothetical protein